MLGRRMWRAAPGVRAYGSSSGDNWRVFATRRRPRPVKQRIQELKKEIGALKGAAGGAAGKKKERVLLKTPKVRALAPSIAGTNLFRHRARVTMDRARCTRASTSSVL